VAALQLHSALYVILQCTGAIAGAALSAGLMPRRDIFFGDGGGGCFDRMTINKLLSDGQIFGCADCVCSAAKHSSATSTACSSPALHGFVRHPHPAKGWGVDGSGQSGRALPPGRSRHQLTFCAGGWLCACAAAGRPS
jgi:hypothetical protein